MLAKLFGRAAISGLSAAVMLVGLGLGEPAAQTNTQWDSLYDRIIRLEHKLRALEAGGYQTTETTAADPASNATQSLRIDRVEADLRTLLGQVQELAHQVKQLSDRLKRFSSDVEYRFEQLGVSSSDRSQNDNSSATKQPTRTANSTYQLPSYGDLSVLEQYPQENSSETDQSSSDGSQTLGTIPQSLLQTDTARLNAVPDPVATQPLDNGVDPNGPDALYEASYDSLLKRRFGAAERGFKTFLKRHSKHKLAGNAQYWLGESYYARGRYKQAAKAFLTGYRSYSKSAKAPDSMLKLGMSLRRLGQDKPACQTFAQIKSRFPKASANVKRLAARERQRAGCS